MSQEITRIKIFREMYSLDMVSTNWAIKNILGLDSKREFRKLKKNNMYGGA